MKIMTFIKTMVPALIMGVSFAAVAAPEAPAKSSHNPVGYWLTGIDTGDNGTQIRRAKVELYNCGSKICGKIIALKEPTDKETGQPKLDKHNEDESKRNNPVLGMDMVFDMAPDASESNKWVGGTLYDAKKGKTYSGYFIMDSNDKIKLTGTVLGGLFERTQEWIRTTKDAGF